MSGIAYFRCETRSVKRECQTVFLDAGLYLRFSWRTVRYEAMGVAVLQYFCVWAKFSISS